MIESLASSPLTLEDVQMQINGFFYEDYKTWQYSHASLNDGGYILRNVSLGDFVVQRRGTYTNLDTIAYYTPRPHGTS